MDVMLTTKRENFIIKPLLLLLLLMLA